MELSHSLQPNAIISNQRNFLCVRSPYILRFDILEPHGKQYELSNPWQTPPNPPVSGCALDRDRNGDRLPTRSTAAPIRSTPAYSQSQLG